MGISEFLDKLKTADANLALELVEDYQRGLIKCEYEKCDLGNTHSIESSNVLTCADTGRVIAVFYNEHDLNNFIKR